MKTLLIFVALAFVLMTLATVLVPVHAQLKKIIEKAETFTPRILKSCEIPAGTYDVELRVAGAVRGMITHCKKTDSTCDVFGGGFFTPIGIVPYTMTVDQPVNKSISIENTVTLAEVCAKHPEKKICDICGEGLVVKKRTIKIPCEDVNLTYSFNGKTSCIAGLDEGKNFYRAFGRGLFRMNYYKDTPEEFSFVFAAVGGIASARFYNTTTSD